MKSVIAVVCLVLGTITAGEAAAQQLTAGERVFDGRGNTGIILNADVFGQVLVRVEPFPIPELLDPRTVGRMEGCGRVICVGDWVRSADTDLAKQALGVRPDGIVITADAGESSPKFQYHPEADLTKIERCYEALCLNDSVWTSDKQYWNPNFLEWGPVVGYSAEKGTISVKLIMESGNPVKDYPVAEVGRKTGCGNIYCVGDDTRWGKVDGVFSDGSVVVVYEPSPGVLYWAVRESQDYMLTTSGQPRRSQDSSAGSLIAAD